MTYKGALYSDLPNLASVFGYTNASWTLKADLLCGYVCRLLNYMEKHGYDSARRATPIRPWSVCRSSTSPRAISSGRWTSCRDKDRAGLGRSIRTTCADIIALQLAPVDDGVLEFTARPTQPERSATATPARAVQGAGAP